MSNRNNMIPIPGRLHSVAVGEPVSGADEVLDDALNMEQSEINQLTVGTKNASTGTTGAYPYNGMGRVVLHKNMVNGVNTLTKDMLYKGDPGSRVPNTNTIFVIQYDFTLGEDITVPENCVLEFDGGSISGDGSGKNTITCENTTIIAEPIVIFYGVILTGTITEDLVLNNFAHSSDCVNSQKNTGKAIHVIGTCTIDEPMSVETGFSIYGDSMYKTRIQLSSSYSGTIKSIFIFNSAKTPVYYTTFRDFAVIGGVDYVFYRKQDDASSGSFQVADFFNLYFDTIKKSVYHFECYGFGCVNIINNYFIGDTTGATPLIYFNGYWFNNNTIEKCRCSGTNGGFLKIRTVPKGSNHGECNQNKFIDNWLEKITLRQNVEYLVDIQSEYNLQVFTISKNYFEQIKKSDSSYASLFKIMSENGVVRAVSFTNNFILGQYIVLHLNNDTNIDVSNNGPYVSDTYQTIKTNGKLRVYNYNNASLLTFDAPTVYNCNLNSIPQLNLFSDRLHHCTFINKMIQAGATERISLMPDLGNKIPYWSDVQIIRGSSKGVGIIEGKIGQLGNSARFFVTSQQDSVLTITPINNSTTVDITNTSEVSVEIRIGVIVMIYV